MFEYETFLNGVEEYRIKIRKAIHQKAEWEKIKTGQYALKLKYLHPQNKLRDKQQRTVELEERLRQTMERKIDDKKRRFGFYIERMKGLSPLAKLNQGFAYVSTENGKVGEDNRRYGKWRDTECICDRRCDQSKSRRYA